MKGGGEGTRGSMCYLPNTIEFDRTCEKNEDETDGDHVRDHDMIHVVMECQTMTYIRTEE